MSVELISVLIAVLAIGATLAGLILTSSRGLRQDIRQDMGAAGNAVARRHEAIGRPRGTAGAWPSQAGRLAGRIARGHHRADHGPLKEVRINEGR